MKYIYKIFSAGMLASAFMISSCDDFLERMPEDDQSVSDAYSTEAQLVADVNTLYNSPWFDLERALLPVGDGMAGNYYNPNPDGWLPFTRCEVSSMSTNSILQGASNTLNSVVTHSSLTIANIGTLATGLPEETRNKYIGEAYVMKAMAYFFLVRMWGDVPVVGDLEKTISEGASYDIRRTKKEDVYKFIISTLIYAADLLPESSEAGRIDKYSAYGLLSKVYLTAAGVSGTLNSEYLEKSMEYASKVYNCGHHPLEPEYENLYRISTGDDNAEGLITLHFNCTYQPYTSINMIQCDIAPQGMNGNNSWGGYAGPSIDLQRLFGVDPFSWVDDADGIRKDDVYDARRHGNIMMMHDYFPYLWRNTANTLGSKGLYLYKMGSKEENNVDLGQYENFGNMVMNSPTCAQNVKMIFGNVEDHVAECGKVPEAQGSCVPIHLLRAADVYLCYAEACLLKNGSVTGEALDAYKKVIERAGVTNYDYSNITFDEIFNQRRKELAFEGDNWFDIVRLSYYDEAAATAKLEAPERGCYENWDSGFNYYDFLNGTMKETDGITIADAEYCRTNAIKSIKAEIVPVNQVGDKFVFPYIENDLLANPGLREPAEDFDFSSISYYDESKI